GLALLFSALTPCILFSMGSPEAVRACLAQVELPDEVYLSIPEAHLPAVAAYYHFDNDPSGEGRYGIWPMWRMALRSTAPLPNAPQAPVVRLGPDDAPRIQALYAHGGPFTPDAFDAYQLEDGVFFGVVEGGGELAAVGGTHIVDWSAGLATIGNMYTRPDCRGRGLAGAVLRAIVGELRARRVEIIALNVDQRNDRARRLYERHGFEIHCGFLEGVGRRREL
ncbi:MAG TPA: GNAT family N-acetyltransferase, partial [Caldilineaceae bacterium]|nr:GNAT family N-acetyltransferase [Caldilineaceae bacterium]